MQPSQESFYSAQGTPDSRYELIEVLAHTYEDDDGCSYKYDVVGIVRESVDVGQPCEYKYAETIEQAIIWTDDAAQRGARIEH